MSYEYVSSSGCERCDAMEGIYEDEPGRPHPNCTCEIIELEADGEHVIEVHWEPGATEVVKDQDPWVIRRLFHIVVYCCGLDIDVLEDHVVVESDWDDDVDEANAEIESDIDAAIEELVDQCPDPECSSLLVS